MQRMLDGLSSASFGLPSKSCLRKIGVGRQCCPYWNGGRGAFGLNSSNSWPSALSEPSRQFGSCTCTKLKKVFHLLREFSDRFLWTLWPLS